MLRVLVSRNDYYLKIYGDKARLRVAIHCGEVAAGEIGDWKKEIALLGDPMNTAARIEGAAKALDASIVLSDDIAGHLSPGTRNSLARLLDFAATGKREKLVLWSAPFDS